MSRIQRVVFAIASLLGLAVGPAEASTTYTLSNVNISANVSDPGLVISTYVVQPVPYSFQLIDGQSHAFDLFEIWTDEASVDGDDTVPKAISVTLDFASPVPGGSSGIVGGSTVGVSQLFGLYQFGQVIWGGPVDVNLGGFHYTIGLSNAAFNAGFFGLNQGQGYGARVVATVTQISAVPEPGTMALAASGLGVLGFVGLRRLRRRNDLTV